MTPAEKHPPKLPPLSDANRGSFADFDERHADDPALAEFDLRLRAHLTRLGERVRALRKSYGLTQSELARRANVTQAKVSSVEAGTMDNGPNYKTMLKLATALGDPTIAAMAPDPIPPLPGQASAAFLMDVALLQATREGWAKIERKVTDFLTGAAIPAWPAHQAGTGALTATPASTMSEILCVRRSNRSAVDDFEVTMTSRPSDWFGGPYLHVNGFAHAITPGEAATNTVAINATPTIIVTPDGTGSQPIAVTMYPAKARG